MARSWRLSKWSTVRNLLPWSIALFLAATLLAAGNAGENGDAPVDDRSFQVRLKSRAFTSAEMLKKFDSPADEVYRLGEGDEITLDIWGRPELSGKHEIGPDGRITLPVVGSIRISGLTREEGAADDWGLF